MDWKISHHWITGKRPRSEFYVACREYLPRMVENGVPLYTAFEHLKNHHFSSKEVYGFFLKGIRCEHRSLRGLKGFEENYNTSNEYLRNLIKIEKKGRTSKRVQERRRNKRLFLGNMIRINETLKSLDKLYEKSKTV